MLTSPLAHLGQGAVGWERPGSDPSMAVLVEGSPIQVLNRLMGYESQCIWKMAVSQQGRGTRYPFVRASGGPQGLTFFGDFGMSNVLVIDQEKQPCQPVHPAQARLLLSTGRATVYRRFPFVIRLKTVQHQPTQPLRLKFDPGAKTTGIAIVHDHIGQVMWAAELSHRGEAIRAKLARRRAIRRSRRQRHTRYRPARFANRRRRPGWLPPSLMSRVDNVLSWTARLRRWCPIGAITIEVVRFDTQALMHPAIEGRGYQQGTLFGYEVRQYLLEKWNRTCVYCDATSVPLQIEHVVPKSRGGSDRFSNLVLSCEVCNLKKGTLDVSVFMAKHPERLERLRAGLKIPLQAAAAVNATRLAIYEGLKATGLLIEMSTGGRTQYNRLQLGLPKHHWIDAAAAGASTPPALQVAGIRPWLITARGQQSRQMTNVNKYGFPISKPKGPSRVQGFRTGDLIKAMVPASLASRGVHLGRVLVRARGSFDIRTGHGRVTHIPARYCTKLQSTDGYEYAQGAAFPPHVHS
jgi:5-methylcytosine-specific restriction endonuclease McrA